MIQRHIVVMLYNFLEPLVQSSSIADEFILDPSDIPKWLVVKRPLWTFYSTHTITRSSRTDEI